MSAHTEANEITASSKSNLAMALVCLPKDRRQDMHVFYAFCRLVDDIADDGTVEAGERGRQLDNWVRWTGSGCEDEPALAPAVRGLAEKYNFPLSHLHEIIAGVRMDLDGADYETWADLQQYCHRVASVVGLVSVEIFGYSNPESLRYALSLGLALQTTNIIRDVKTDLLNEKRIYLPKEDFERFGVDRSDLEAASRTPQFREMMEFQAERSQGFYDDAKERLPSEDAANMVASEIMLAIYHEILDQARKDGFRMFEKDYRVSHLRKLAIIAKYVGAAKLGLAG